MDISHFSLLTCFCHWLRMTTSNKRNDDDNDGDFESSRNCNYRIRRTAVSDVPIITSSSHEGSPSTSELIEPSCGLRMKTERLRLIAILLRGSTVPVIRILQEKNSLRYVIITLPPPYIGWVRNALITVVCLSVHLSGLDCLLGLYWTGLTLLNGFSFLVFFLGRAVD